MVVNKGKESDSMEKIEKVIQKGWIYYVGKSMLKRLSSLRL